MPHSHTIYTKEIEDYKGLEKRIAVLEGQVKELLNIKSQFGQTDTDFGAKSTCISTTSTLG